MLPSWISAKRGRLARSWAHRRSGALVQRRLKMEGQGAQKGRRCARFPCPQMLVDARLEALRPALQAAGQGHLLQYADEGKLSESELATLLDQINEINMPEVNRMFSELGVGSGGMVSTPKMDFSPISDVASCTASPANDLASWEARGLEAIRQGTVAALVLSGGQGSRLGFDGPKGMYKVGLPSGKSIFQLMAERIIRLSELAGAPKRIPFYVMTSPLNDAVTREFFASNKFFGLEEADVVFFAQGTMPCFSLDGKILLETPCSISRAPDGNGSIYQSMRRSGVLEDMGRRGVTCFHVFSVDNVLVKVADPVFIGYCLAVNVDCGNKVVWKAHAGEKVGVVVNKGGKPTVVEYSEMDTDTTEAVDANGKLLYGAGNICSHFFTLDFITDRVLPNLHDIYHAARKKIPCVTFPSTETVKPDKEKGIKLEAFIFDVFPLCAKMALFEVAREDEFAPVKDAPGGLGDTPEKACSMLSAECKRWVQAAGAKVADGPGLCEISPLVSYKGEGLEERVKGKTLEAPFRLL